MGLKLMGHHTGVGRSELEGNGLGALAELRNEDHDPGDSLFGLFDGEYGLAGVAKGVPGTLDRALVGPGDVSEVPGRGRVGGRINGVVVASDEREQGPDEDEGPETGDGVVSHGTASFPRRLFATPAPEDDASTH